MIYTIPIQRIQNTYLSDEFTTRRHRNCAYDIAWEMNLQNGLFINVAACKPNNCEVQMLSILSQNWINNILQAHPMSTEYSDPRGPGG